jgi:hypothetical protein
MSRQNYVLHDNCDLYNRQVTLILPFTSDSEWNETSQITSLTPRTGDLRFKLCRNGVSSSPMGTKLQHNLIGLIPLITS